MSDPGTADLSADVDFSFLKQAITNGSGTIISFLPINGENHAISKSQTLISDVTAYGLITQKDFLQYSGIRARI